jgi:hypothetical protein
LALAGVPLNRPVVVLKEAQEGSPVTENTSVFLSGSDAEG